MVVVVILTAVVSTTVIGIERSRGIESLVVRILFKSIDECVTFLLGRQGNDCIEVFFRGYVVRITFDARRYCRANRSSLMGSFVVDLRSTHLNIQSIYIPSKQ